MQRWRPAEHYVLASPFQVNARLVETRMPLYVDAAHPSVRQHTDCTSHSPDNLESDLVRRCVMKWVGMHFLGFTILMGGIFAALLTCWQVLAGR